MDVEKKKAFLSGGSPQKIKKKHKSIMIQVRFLVNVVIAAAAVYFFFCVCVWRRRLRTTK